MPIPNSSPQHMSYQDHVASGALHFDIKRVSGATDAAPINNSALIKELGSRLYEIGDEFLGRYEVLVSDIWDKDSSPHFKWKPFSCGQRGVGFFIGHTFDEAKLRYPGRSCSLKPPAHIDVESLCEALHGKPLLKKMPPALKLVPDPVEVESPLVLPAAGDTERLASALASRKAQRNRRDASMQRCDALEAEIAQLEQTLASSPSFDARVAQRLAEVRAQYGL